MMRFELGLEEPDPKRAVASALTIAGSYIVGGCIPLSPYFLSTEHKRLSSGLWHSQLPHSQYLVSSKGDL